MVTIAYVRTTFSDHYLQKQIATLEYAEYAQLVIEPLHIEQNTISNKVLNETIESLSPNDTLLIYQLDCLGKSLAQLELFLKYLEKQEIFLKSMQDNIDTSNPHDTFMETAIKLIQMERSVATQNTLKGLANAKANGKTGGRPPLSQEMIDKIRNLYFEHSYGLKRISEECGVSIGSVYKYIHDNTI